MAGPTTHHCPKKYKGGCRKEKTPRFKKHYCPEHQTYCKNPGCEEIVHLRTEECVKCAGKRQADEKKKKDEERRRKAKEDSEKKAAQQAQSMRDKNPRNKQQKY
jgi:hypothetical protein